MKLRQTAEHIVKILSKLPQVKSCKIYGSLANNSYDEFSDIDIEIDVSGVDNGKFMLSIVDLVKDKIDIIYSDYAPSLIPEFYIVSVAIDQNNPFRVVDFRCTANPHYTSVTKEYVKTLNDKYNHTLKLWTANLKHFVRKKDCYNDIVNMAEKINLQTNGKTEAELLYSTLQWLKDNATQRFVKFVKSCDYMFNKLVK